MEIEATITGIGYKKCLENNLEVIDISRFDINLCPATCIIKDEKKTYAISKWVSPKRTRSYPYERVYNSLSIPKKITVIPVIKDEGFKGDRDFIQWDTVSLMSLLDVYVILGYYIQADKHKTRKDKITNQQFDNEYILSKINEIKNYHSSALHWNHNEIKTNLSNIIDKVKTSYSKIGNTLNVKFHNEKGLDDFRNNITEDTEDFMKFSRKKAIGAQAREMVTVQPKESLQTLTKAKITIKNYLGGAYYFTVDEILIDKKLLSLIESKHSKSSILPSISDIKDGLLKMILYCNFATVTLNGSAYKSIPILKLTSTKVKGEINSSSSAKDIQKFIKENNINKKQSDLLERLFEESKSNNFITVLAKG